MAPKDQDHGDGFPRLRSPIQSAGVLLGIFVAMYLAVAGLLRVTTTPDAIAAVAPHHSMTVSMPAAASNSEAKISSEVSAPIPTPEASKAPSDNSPEAAAEPKDDSWQCKPSLAIDSLCALD